MILHTLEATSWVIGGLNGAAKLGLKRTTLICKMQRLGICRPVLQSSSDLMGIRTAGAGPGGAIAVGPIDTADCRLRILGIEDAALIKSAYPERSQCYQCCETERGRSAFSL